MKSVDTVIAHFQFVLPFEVDRIKKLNSTIGLQPKAMKIMFIILIWNWYIQMNWIWRPYGVSGIPNLVRAVESSLGLQSVKSVRIFNLFSPFANCVEKFRPFGTIGTQGLLSFFENAYPNGQHFLMHSFSNRPQHVLIIEWLEFILNTEFIYEKLFLRKIWISNCKALPFDAESIRVVLFPFTTPKNEVSILFKFHEYSLCRIIRVSNQSSIIRFCEIYKKTFAVRTSQRLRYTEANHWELMSCS